MTFQLNFLLIRSLAFANYFAYKAPKLNINILIILQLTEF